MDLNKHQEPNLDFYKWMSFGIIPVLLFVVSTWLIVTQGPYYLGPNLDPEYAYLLNSLDVSQFIAPGHTDHPGTPLQVLGAIVILLKYSWSNLFQSTETIQYEVLSNPESYLRAINLTLNSLIMILVFLTGRKVYQLKRNWFLAISMQLTPLLFATLLKATTRVSPEPLLVVAVLWLSLVLIPAFANEYQISTKSSALLGVILGFGVATKVTVLPLVLFILFPEGWKRKLATLTTFILSFFVFTIPSWPRLMRLGKWLISIAIRDGHYGHGRLGLPDWSVLRERLISFILDDPGFFVLVVIAFVPMIYAFSKRGIIVKSRANKNFVKVISIFLSIFVVQTAISVKHPPIHYMVPAMTLVGVLLFAFSNFPKTFWQSNSQEKYFAWLISIFLFFSLLSSFTVIIDKSRAAQEYYESVVEVLDLVNSSYQDCVVIYYYRSSSIQYALTFGDIFAKTNFRETLESLYPSIILYGINSQGFHDYGDNSPISRDDIQAQLNSGECLLMQGTSFSSEKYKKHATSLDLKQLNNNLKGEALYKLLGFRN